MSECDSSDHPVSDIVIVVEVVVVVDVNFFSFSTSSLEPLNRIASYFVLKVIDNKKEVCVCIDLKKFIDYIIS